MLEFLVKRGSGNDSGNDFGATGVASAAGFAIVVSLVIDTLFGLVRAGSPSGTSLALSLSLVTIGIVGLTLTVAAVEWLSRRFAARRTPLVVAAVISVAAMTTLAVWSTPYPLVLAGLCTVGAGVVAAVVLKLPDRWSSAALGLGAAAALTADAIVLPGLYLNFHDALVLGVFGGIYGVARRMSLHRGFGLVPIVGVIASAVWLTDVSPPMQYVELNTQLGPAARRVAHRMVDLDADGYSSVLGGTDCGPFDASIHPGACETLDDGIDSNCNGIDSIEVAATSEGPQLFDQPPDVVLVLNDAMRADLAGLDLSSLPALEELERDSVSFSAAYTPFPSTRLALRALFGSSPAGYPWEDRHLPGELVAMGYRAQAISNGEKTDLGEASLSFIGVPPAETKRRGTVATLEAFEAFQRDRPADDRATFTWLHTYDLHAPLVEPGETPIDRYRAAIATVDTDIARIRAAIASRDRPTLLIVTGDHGEEFGEHGGTAHSRSLYDESVRVPLWIAVTGRGGTTASEAASKSGASVDRRVEPRRIEQPVSLIDIAPTIIDSIGGATPPEWYGRNLFLADQGPAHQPRYLSDAFGFDSAAGANLPLARMARGPRYKLITNVERRYYELYDLQSDPGEQSPLPSWEHPEVVGRLRAAILAIEERRTCP